jgi:hypothetical protein
MANNPPIIFNTLMKLPDGSAFIPVELRVEDMGIVLFLDAPSGKGASTQGVELMHSLAVALEERGVEYVLHQRVERDERGERTGKGYESDMLCIRTQMTIPPQER